MSTPVNEARRVLWLDARRKTAIPKLEAITQTLRVLHTNPNMEAISGAYMDEDVREMLESAHDDLNWCIARLRHYLEGKD